MTRIEVVTYDVGTGCCQVDASWSVVGFTKHQVSILRRAIKMIASGFAAQDHSTDHVVYMREV